MPMTSLHPVTLCSEGTLSKSTSLDGGDLDGGDPLWSSTSSFLYESSLVTVTLGRRMWGLKQPAYGFNDIVQGAIKLNRKCTHVVRVEVSVETDLFIRHVGTTDSGLFFTAPRKSQGDSVRERIDFRAGPSKSTHVSHCPLLSST